MKRSDSLYIGLIFVVFAASVGAWAVLSPFVMSEAAVTRPTLQNTAQHQYTADGERYTVSPEKFTRLCPATDCIPSLAAGQAQYTTTDAADTWMTPSDTVISVTWNKQTVAYPATIMQHHMIANTRIGDTPVVVTYAPHAGYAAAFSRQLRTTAGLQNLSFAFTGSLLHGDIVMRDTGTGTRWSPYHGAGIVGKLAGTRLRRIDTNIVRWGIWKQQHPNGVVLSRDTGIYRKSQYADDPYFGYRESADVPGPTPALDGLHPKDTVYGVTVNGGAVAYRAVHGRDMELIQDTVGNQPILLVQDETAGTVHGFSRQINGETLSFSRNSSGTLQSQDGTVWTPQGYAVDGPLAGRRLNPVRLARMYWFTWKQFTPSTRLYAPPE